MTAVRLRVLRRHSSLELGLDEFIIAELSDRHGQPDLNLSVYDVDETTFVRTHAEHAASLLQPEPKKTRGGLSLANCSGTFDVESTPGERIDFAYARERHRELRFLRAVELRQVAEQIWREQTARARSASGQEIIAYGRERIDAEDEEWVAACAARPKWQRLLCK